MISPVVRSLFRRFGMPLFMLSLLLVVPKGSPASDNNGPGPGIIPAKLTVEASASDNSHHINLLAALAVQNRHSPYLLSLPEVVGTATSMDEGGNPAILILLEKTIGPDVFPATLDGVPVIARVTGKMVAMQKPSWAGGPGSGTDSGGIDPTSRFERPVPIGVSTGNNGECSSGTIGARVTDGNNVFALSNNHVYALENSAQINSELLQPGRYDTNCGYNPADVIGNLFDYEPLDFSGLNTIDAAIAITTVGEQGNVTPADGYGTPKSLPVEAAIGDQVQKYGRTTGLTQGEVTGINASVRVGYSAGTALFTGQILVESNKPFIKAGDSGSLLVTSDRSPTGLLFAGNQSGKFAVANPIGPVLDRFNVSIDGE